MVLLSEEMPDLEMSDSDGECNDDNADESWETTSSTSSVDSACDFFQQRFDEDHLSTSCGEESEDRDSSIGDSENLMCITCLKPKWGSSNIPSRHHCRDFCMHKSSADDNTASTNQPDAAPSMLTTMDAPSYGMALMPAEVEEIHMKSKGMYDARETPPPPPGLHREKEHPRADQLNPLIAWYNLVAKPVPRKQWETNARAATAVNNEWAKLRLADGGLGTWDESVAPTEYWEAQKEAKDKLANTGVHTHFGTLFDLCVVKHSELEEAKHKYKGRVVFGGHRIHDEHGLAAEFPEQGSGASFLSASKLCDAVSLLPGCYGEQSDAPSAYTQSKLGTGMKNPYVVTWVELPQSQWRPEWKAAGMRRPCCQLRLSLYGHPMSGKYWENHFTEKLKSVGFESIPGWECLFAHQSLKLILSVYVDDFKLVGRAENLPKGWALMEKSGLVLDPPDPLGDYLGCGQFPIEITPAEQLRRLEHAHPLLEGSVDLSAVKTAQPVRAIRYNMFGFFQQCVDVYVELAKVPVESLKKVTTPSIDDHNLKPEDFEQDGALAKDAAKIIMKMLYGARLVRFELLWPICSLARQVSKWTKACDKRLHRLVSYVYHTLDHSLESFVGDDPALCHPILFSDADFAGEIVGAKSTSGCYLAIVGPNTFAPITASCKKQTCVSHSSTESEIVAAEQAVRTEGLQALAFWEFVVDLLSDTHGAKKMTETSGKVELNPYSERFDPVRYFASTRRRGPTVTDLIIAEDNQAVIKIVQKARSTALRHLPRTHRIDLQWLFEVCSNPHVCMRYVGTLQQVADLMTKALNKPETWFHLLEIAQIRGGLTSEAKAVKTQIAGKALAIQSNSCDSCGFIVSGGQCACSW